MIDCERMGELLPRYADGEATPDERELIEEHLGRCDDCRSMPHALRNVDAIVAALPVVPEQMRSRLPIIDAGVRRGMQRRPLSLPALRVWGHAWSLAASVAFVLFIGAIALVLSSALSRMQQTTPPTAPPDAWAQARAVLPPSIPVYKPAFVPSRFGPPTLVDARLSSRADEPDGPAYTIRYSAGGENLVFILGLGAGEWGNMPPPERREPVKIDGTGGELFTNAEASFIGVTWQEQGRSYQIKAYSSRMSKDELLQILGSLAPMPTPGTAPQITPVASPQPGKIAFVQGGDIWTKDLPDGEAKRLTQDGRNSEPRWSPSGEWLAFRKERTVWLMRSSGSEARQIEGSDVFRFAWSPVADQLAFIDQGGLFTVDADDSKRLQLSAPTGESGAGVLSVAWSPDGQWLAYALTDLLEGGQQGQPPQRHASLWRQRADGSEPTELLDAGKPSTYGLTVAGWTPDGKRILFRTSPQFSASGEADGQPLKAVPIDGGEPVEIAPRLLTHPDFVAGSPSGNLLALTVGGGRETWPQKRIGVVDLSSGTLAYVTDATEAAFSPSWSPDSQRIVYTSGPDIGFVGGGDKAKTGAAKRRIWTMSRDGSGKRQLTNDAAYRDERPRWSGDGNFILFGRLQDERAQLWLMRPDGSEQRLVADDLGVPKTPTTPPVWVGFYGHLDWDQLYDWWTGEPAPTPNATYGLPEAGNPSPTAAATDEWGRLRQEMRFTPLLRPKYLPPALADVTPRVSIGTMPILGTDHELYSVLHAKGDLSLMLTGLAGVSPQAGEGGQPGTAGWRIRAEQGLVAHQADPTGVQKETAGFRGGTAGLLIYISGGVFLMWREKAGPPSASSVPDNTADFMLQSGGLPVDDLLLVAESLESVGMMPGAGACPQPWPTAQSSAEANATYRPPASDGQIMALEEAKARVRTFLGEPNAALEASLVDGIPGGQFANRRFYEVRREAPRGQWVDTFRVDALTGEVTEADLESNTLRGSPKEAASEAEARMTAEAFARTRFAGFARLTPSELDAPPPQAPPAGKLLVASQWWLRAPDSGAQPPTGLLVGVDPDTGRVSMYSAQRVGYQGATVPKISKERAVEIALAEAGKDSRLAGAVPGRVELVVEATRDGYKLGWFVGLQAPSQRVQVDHFTVDALSGEVLNPVGSPRG